MRDREAKPVKIIDKHKDRPTDRQIARQIEPNRYRQTDVMIKKLLFIRHEDMELRW